MPRVIKEAPIVEKKVVCPHCGCTIGYVENDIQESHGTDISGGPDGEEYIRCPGCSKKITLRSW
jgi:DNA-directed RNA polymerase subunit RPC12/RpoP